jgi:predicted transcriptional regulator
MEHIEIFCQRVLSTGSAFGIRTDSGEQTFIPSIVVRASNLQEGETTLADLVPNKHDSSSTPWFVVRIPRENHGSLTTEVAAEDREPEALMEAPVTRAASLPSIDARAYQALQGEEWYLTTAEVAAALGTETTAAHNALLRLFNQGKIAKADVYASGGQSRPSFCLWATSAREFVGAETDEDL